MVAPAARQPYTESVPIAGEWAGYEPARCACHPSAGEGPAGTPALPSAPRGQPYRDVPSSGSPAADIELMITVEAAPGMAAADGDSCTAWATPLDSL